VVDRWRECRRVIRHHSKSFDLASRLFPSARRDEVAALYGWCRTCDDAIDLAPPSAHRSAVEDLRTQLREVYAGASQDDPVLHCFQEVVKRRCIPIEYPAELLGGMAMDVENASYETIDDVLTYCWRVAGTVGLMMCHVMGVSDGRAAPHAAHLGIAMQITNICRDVVEDWERGRVYLPAEFLSPEFGKWLKEHALADERPPLPEAARTELASATGQLLAWAERYYASAEAGMRYLAPRSALAVRSARLVYAEIGRRIEARGCDVMLGRAVVPTRRKLQLVSHALRRFAADRRTWPATELIAPEGILQCADAVRLA
jgi:phytoene synthase